MDKQFFMVYADGKSAPTFKHETYESARLEAKRLSHMLNVKTYILSVAEEINEIPLEVEAAEQYTDMNFSRNTGRAEFRNAFLAGVRWQIDNPF